MNIKKCYICKKIFITKTRSTKKYCSKECEKKSRRMSGFFKECEICGNTFEVPRSNHDQRFCSIKCQGKWQSTQTGKLNSRYKRVKTTCDWCGKTYDMRNYLVGTFKNHFCSEGCRREWYAKDFSQREEWKEEISKKTTKRIVENTFGKTKTAPQIKLNAILDELNICYKNEYNCEFYAIDNAIFYNDKIYFIEVMGSFWHCDIRNYPTIPYGNQHDRIIVDKSKKTYVENKYDTKILYLWEDDVKNDKLCQELIVKFINEQLTHYHSSDYLIKNNELLINEKAAPQYIEQDSNYIKEHIDFVEKGRIRPQNQKQPDKWITYNCELCGNEKEMLKSHYKKAKHHFCCPECRIEGLRKGLLK